MRKVILLGTKHPLQEGKLTSDFSVHIKELCKTHSIKAIAEEMNENISIANMLSKKEVLSYKNIEANPEERKTLGIEDRIDIIFRMLCKYDINDWDTQFNNNTLPPEALSEYNADMQETNRQREDEWLKRIKELDTYPVLVICGANHHAPFSKLLSESGFEVTEEDERWGCE